ncbi:MAG TPA: ABC transporter substrate-binding protein [Micropepsaceae bacterium]|nr:ABC transporter substrate-binding protein [Micropepsaceae bacterium]
MKRIVMLWRGFAAQLLAFALIAVVAGSAQPALAQSGNPAEAFVQQNVDRGYQILNNQSLSSEQRRDQFRNFLLNLTDLHRIGMFTLGQYANNASPADLQSFERAFEDYAVTVYETRLGKYNGQTLKVTGSEVRAPDDVIVNAVVTAGGGASQQPIHVAFRVRKTPDGRPIITDMQVEGIWLALSQRSDFTSFLQQHGGSVSQLADHLRTQAAQVRGEAHGNSVG